MEDIKTSTEFDKLVNAITSSSATSEEKIEIIEALASYIASL
jgi:hypothetical protein